MEKPTEVELDEKEAKQLLERLESNNLSSGDKNLLVGVINFFIWLQWAYKNASLKLSYLGKLLGFKSEKGNKLRKNSSKNKEGESSNKNRDGPKEAPENEKPKKGHGKRGHEDYTRAEDIRCSDTELSAGAPCPDKCGGKLYEIEPGVVLKITGSPIALAKKYNRDRVRCAGCGKSFTAALPEGVSEEGRYDEKLKAVLSLSRYSLSVPFYRLESFQEKMGVPISDATQWELVEEVGDCLYPVYRELEKQAAQGEVVHNDDTKVKILSLLKENEEDPERKGMFTTAIVSRVGKETIILYKSGRKHAGENLGDVLSKRQSKEPPIHMADASPSNPPKGHTTILCKCLSHGRRNFVDAYGAFSEKCDFVIGELAKVFGHEKMILERGVSAEERLLYHQEHSKPVMENLKKWMNEQFNQKLVEPNGGLGRAIAYMLKHWDGLTAFLMIAGAPLHNNVCERALRLIVRSRKNSLFYKTEHGALIGDIHKSVIATCAEAKENPFDYLVAIQRNRSSVNQNPALWLPYNYRDHLREKAG